jgi:hypothetical protein
MFTKLAKSRFAGVRLIRSGRAARLPQMARLPGVTFSNDNLPASHRAAAARKRRATSPTLICRWFDRGGRLECHWEIEANEIQAASSDEAEQPVTDRACLIRNRRHGYR